MAPDLAGFTTDSSDSQTDDEITASALAALSAEFGVTAEPAAPAAPRAAAGAAGDRQSTWFDTFDWRLHKAGLQLEYVPGRGGSELRLSARDESAPVQPIAVQPVTGFPPSRPHLIADLADGPVGKRLAGVIEMRALLPVVATSTVTTVYRLLNGDEKTVARLSVERWSVTGTQAGPMPSRLIVAGVRGYLGQARRAAKLLAAVRGVKPCCQPPFADAVRAAGRTPGDYSSKVTTDLTGRMPAASAATAIMLRLLDTLDANTDGVLADIDSEFLHDLRVAVRRTRSALKLFGDALDGLSPDELAFFAAEFKWVGDLTTPVRDLDVHLLDFDAMAHRVAAAQPSDLEPLRAFLAQRRRKEVRLLVRGLRSPRFTALTQEWRARLHKVAQDTGITAVSRARDGSVGGGGTAGLLAAERTRVAFAKVARRGAAITPDSPPEDLHSLRKRCKELRYALEFFAPLYEPAGYAKVLGDLKKLQDCLGVFQDTEVQMEEIRALATAMLDAQAAPAATLLAMGEIVAGLLVAQGDARADFERKFAAFAGVEGQRRMAALLRGPRGELRNADLCDLQHQGGRREDHHGGQPRVPRRGGGPAHAAVGPGPAGRGELHVPGQAQGQGRRQGAGQGHAAARRRGKGHRLRQPRPDPRGLHLPEPGPAARRRYRGG
jgi:CHAD domain-containing protein